MCKEVTLIKDINCPLSECKLFIPAGTTIVILSDEEDYYIGGILEEPYTTFPVMHDEIKEKIA